MIQFPVYYIYIALAQPTHSILIVGYTAIPVPYPLIDWSNDHEQTTHTTGHGPRFTSSQVAMQSAVQRAQDVAKATGTTTVIRHDGVIEQLTPDT